MSTTTVRVWGIHASKLLNADSYFLSEGVVAIGWPEMGDLALLPATTEAFKAKLSETYPDAKPGSIPVNAGQLYRFVHDMREGDMIVYAATLERVVHLGKVSGSYRYDQSGSRG